MSIAEEEYGTGGRLDYSDEDNMSDFIPEEELAPQGYAEEFRDKVQERLEERGIIEGEDPFDILYNALADIHIAVQQAYIIVSTIRRELEGE